MLVPVYVFRIMIETPGSGIPVVSVTTPVMVFSCAVDSSVISIKVRNNVSLRSDDVAECGIMCSIAIVLEFYLLRLKLGKKS